MDSVVPQELDATATVSSVQESDNTVKFGEASPFVIGISIALFIFGILTNVRKCYLIRNNRRKSQKPFGQIRKASEFEIYASTLFGSNIAGLSSAVFFALLEIFPSATVCPWRMCSEAVFRLATPTFLVLLATSPRPRAEVSGAKCKLCLLFVGVIVGIAAASAPYFLYGGLEETSVGAGVVEVDQDAGVEEAKWNSLAEIDLAPVVSGVGLDTKTRDHRGGTTVGNTNAESGGGTVRSGTGVTAAALAAEVSESGMEPSPQADSTAAASPAISGADDVSARRYCAFQPPTRTAAYVIFAYSVILAYLIPTAILLLKLCIFNTAHHILAMAHHTDEYKKYVINTIVIWIICSTPYWTIETYTFFSSRGVAERVPAAVAHILHTLPWQIGYVCFPFTCPEMLADRRNRGRRLDETRREIFEEDHPGVGSDCESQRKKEETRRRSRGLGWITKKRSSPSERLVSTLLSCTLSLTFPLISLRSSESQNTDIQTVCISVENAGAAEKEELEEETFL